MKRRPILATRILAALALASGTCAWLAIAPPPVAAASSVGGLNVSVAYAEDKETNNPNPAAFPIPWAGSPNVIFLGGTVPGQTACGSLTTCYDTGAIRFDNPGPTDVTVQKVVVDIHSSLTGGKVFSLWGSFTVPAGKSVILAANPPNNNPSYDNFDTSGYPPNICTPVTVAPTVTVTIGGVPTTLVDGTHVLDTGGIDRGYCGLNESIAWRPIGANGSDTAGLTLAPGTVTEPVGGSVTETATLVDGGGVPIPSATVNFSVASGPNAGVTGTGVTDANGQAAFTYADAGNAGTDFVVAGVTTVGSIRAQAAVVWGAGGWTGVDIGNPPLAGSDSYSNGVWTISGSGQAIGGTSDQFHYVWQPLAADGGISARVVSQTKPNSRSGAGVMLRQSTDANAPFYALLVTPGSGLFVLQRTTIGGNTATLANFAGAAPAYVSVLRNGGIVTAYTSPDGVTWTPVPGTAEPFAVSGALLEGMAVTSHTTTSLSTAVFDTVQTPTSSPPPPNNFSIGAHPSSFSVVEGATGQTTITTWLISGSPESIVLTASGMPSGVTATLSPGTVTTGGAATLSVSVASTVATGKYKFTVTGSSASATHAVTVTLTVTAPA